MSSPPAHPTPPDRGDPLPVPGRPASAGRAASARLTGVDVARGVALIGIIAVNVMPAESDGGAPLLAWTLLAGRVAALFALIAGISIALASGGRRPQVGRAMTAHRAALALRALLITACGLLLGPTDPPVAIILPYYGILFLLAVPLLGLGRRTLLALALVFALLGPAAMQLVRGAWPGMPEPDGEYTFAVAAADPGAFLTDMLLTGFYPAVPWMAYICVGIALGRLDLGSRRVAAILAAAGTALAASAWLVSAWLLGPGGGLGRLIAATPALDRGEIDAILVFGADADTLPATTGWWLAVLAPYTSTPVTILHTLGTALAALGVVLLLAPLAPRLADPLAAAGTMTLTLYCAHIVVMGEGILDEDRPVMSIAIQCIAFVLGAVLWRNAVGKGPLEGLVAAATSRVRGLVLAGRRHRGTPSGPPEA